MAYVRGSCLEDLGVPGGPVEIWSDASMAVGVLSRKIRDALATGGFKPTNVPRSENLFTHYASSCDLDRAAPGRLSRYVQ